MSTLPAITIIGSGRIAGHLGRRLRGKGLPPAQVLSRTEAHAQALGEALMVPWSDRWADLLPDADWVLLAVRDDAIVSVAEQIAPFVNNALVTHTSGATPGAVLAPFFERYVVFYPLQSFSAERQPVWSKIPFCVDANTPEDLLFLKKTAKTIGNLVYQVNDEQRALLHVAAVFANNFANHCFSIAEQILEKNDLPFEMLHPLMEETVTKALMDSPLRMQTGPAARGDLDTVIRHLALLNEHPHWQDLYRKMSVDINQSLDPA